MDPRPWIVSLPHYCFCFVSMDKQGLNSCSDFQVFFYPFPFLQILDTQKWSWIAHCMFPGSGKDSSDLDEKYKYEQVRGLFLVFFPPLRFSIGYGWTNINIKYDQVRGLFILLLVCFFVSLSDSHDQLIHLGSKDFQKRALKCIFGLPTRILSDSLMDWHRKYSMTTK